MNNRRDGDGVSEKIAEVAEGFDGSAIRYFEAVVEIGDLVPGGLTEAFTP